MSTIRRKQKSEGQVIMKTVLIVEDEPHLRLLYEIELAKAGYHPLVAASGLDCLETIATMRVDLVILDIRMPGMDGVEVLQSIIARWRSVPVIIHTAYSGYRDNYLTWGARAFLTKSSDSRKLIETVDKLLHPERVEPRMQGELGRIARQPEERTNHDVGQTVCRHVGKQGNPRGRGVLAHEHVRFIEQP